eukprot:7402875-Alexandrium_andersonii.AAC.1
MAEALLVLAAQCERGHVVGALLPPYAAGASAPWDGASLRPVGKLGGPRPSAALGEPDPQEAALTTVLYQPTPGAGAPR